MIKQSLLFKLQQKLSPQQIQFIKLLQVPATELEQRIEDELEENPALELGGNEKDEKEDIYNFEAVDKTSGDNGTEENPDFSSELEEDLGLEDYIEREDDVPDYKLNDYNYATDDEERDTQMPIAISESFHDKLTDQLGLLQLDEHEFIVANQIIGSIDDDGYLRRSIESVVDDLAFTQNISCTEDLVLKLLAKVQLFEPAGVGARDLRECLLIQLKRKENQSVGVKNAIRILTDYFEEYTKKHYDRLKKSLSLNEDDLKDADQEIRRLNPKPGNSSTDSKLIQIIPDFIVHSIDGELQLKLNSRNAPDLRISPSYKEMLHHYSKGDKKDKKMKEAVQFVKQKLDSAKWFIDAIKQRQQTLLLTMQAILEKQYEFFVTGDEAKLRPLILKDIADEVNMDISTISRVASSKYVQTEFGTFLLKTFFSEGIMTDSGEEASSKEVKQMMKGFMENEDKKSPLSDEKIAELLNDKGYNIARRTVAKYREQMEIPVARLRKEI